MDGEDRARVEFPRHRTGAGAETSLGILRSVQARRFPATVSVNRAVAPDPAAG